MRLTNQTNYAIRMLMYCGARSGSVRVADIAEFYNLPLPFLLKIANTLKEAGFISAVRGRNGGVQLARRPEKIVLGEVVRATEASFDMAECFGSNDVDCPLVFNCGLNQTLRDALGAFFAVLDRTTVADVMEGRHYPNALQRLQQEIAIPNA